MSRTSEATEELLEELVDADVLVPRDGDEFVLSDAFESKRDSRRRAFEDSDRFERAVAEYTAETPIDPDDVSPALLATVDALDDAVDVDSVDLFRVAFTLGAVDADHPTEGVPQGFVPVRGDEIAAFLALNPAAVIYCWREECTPCDTVVGDFELLLQEGAIPPEVALGAVYGPNYPDLLSEEYDVGVAPTTLFCANGSVDSRFVGARTPDAFKSEIDMILERSAVRP